MGAEGSTFSAGGQFSGVIDIYRITEALALLSIGRTMLYQELRAGRLGSVGDGRARRIPATAIDAYLTLLDREASHGATR